MTTKALTTLLLIFAAIIFFPVIIGLAGAAIGIIFGIFGVIVGVIGSIFGAIFGGFGHIFDHPFHWYGPGISKSMFAIILVIVVVLLSRHSKKAS